MVYSAPPFGDIWKDGIFNVPTGIVDRFLKLASEYQIKALLLVLRNGGRASSSDIAAKLGIPCADAEEIMSFWLEEGVLVSEEAGETQAPKKEAPKKAESAPEPEKPKTAAVPVSEKKEPLPAPRLTSKDIVTLCRENKKLDMLLSEAQVVLGRTISSAEQEMLVNMTIYYGLTAEVILMLLGYYRSEKEKGRSISIAYINKMANSWAEDGVRTIADADEKLLYLASTDKSWDEIMAMTGIRHRSPTMKQREMVSGWKNDFSDEMIMLASDIMKENADKPSLKYMDSVLRRWKKEGITTPSQVQKQQEDFRSHKKSEKKGKLHGEPSYDMNKIISDTMNNTDIKF